jgi:hypothetical protein
MPQERERPCLPRLGAPLRHALGRSWQVQNLAHEGHVLRGAEATRVELVLDGRRTRARIVPLHRYEAEQQYYVYLVCPMYTGSHQPYVKNYAPNALEEYGMAAAVLWLDR